MDEVTQENKDLKVALQSGSGSGRREVVRSGSMAAADQTSPSHHLHDIVRRPVSMYETRDTQVKNYYYFYYYYCTNIFWQILFPYVLLLV